MIWCSHCNRDNDPEAIFCCYCGKTMPTTPPTVASTGATIDLNRTTQTPNQSRLPPTHVPNLARTYRFPVSTKLENGEIIALLAVISPAVLVVLFYGIQHAVAYPLRSAGLGLVAAGIYVAMQKQKIKRRWGIKLLASIGILLVIPHAWILILCIMGWEEWA